MDSIDKISSVPSTAEPPNGPQPGTLVLGEHIRRHNIAVAWVIVSVLGALAIAIFPDQGVWRLLVPCALMLGYLAFAIRQHSRDMEKVADSVYFLGFLWTLFALTEALIVKRGDGIKATDVFSVFGYSLVTTALGMFLRMAVLQFRYTVSDQMLEAREELAAKVETFSHELALACSAIQGFRITAVSASEQLITHWTAAAQLLQGTIEKSTVDALENVKSAVNKVADEITVTANASKQASAAMSGVARTTTSLLKRLETNQERWVGALESGVNSTADAMQDWGQRVRDVQVPPDVFKERVAASVEPIVTGAGVAGNALRDWAHKVQTVEVKSDGFTKVLKDAIQPVHQSADELASKFAAAAASANGAREQLEQLAPAAHSVANECAEVSKNLTEFGHSLARTRETAQSFWSWFRSR